MKKLSIFLMVALCANSASADVGDLAAAISRVRVACSGISDSMSGLKTRAGINTALTGVGTAAGGVALGAGALKKAADVVVDSWEDSLKRLISKRDTLKRDYQYIQNQEGLMASCKQQDAGSELKKAENSVTFAEKEIKEWTDTSKTLGKIRTGTMAGAAVTDTIGTVLAAKNQVDDDLDNRIQECKSAVSDLSKERSRARAENTATAEELQQANDIVSACSEWDNVDLSKIDKRSKGAAISSGTGAVLALAGTITSAKANSDAVRTDDTAQGKEKEEKLNKTSNVLAGGTTAASLTATIFNATQISAIKKAVNAADKCEEALK